MRFCCRAVAIAYSIGYYLQIGNHVHIPHRHNAFFYLRQRGTPDDRAYLLPVTYTTQDPLAGDIISRQVLASLFLLFCVSGFFFFRLLFLIELPSSVHF